MLGDTLDSAALGEWADRLTAPAAQHGVYSAREIRDRAALLRQLRATLDSEFVRAVLSLAPAGRADGLATLDARYRSGSSYRADGQPHRMRLLAGFEHLPFTIFEDLLLHDATLDDLGIDWPATMDPTQRVSVLTDAAALVVLLRLLALLATAGARRFPGDGLALLLMVLTDPSTPAAAVGPRLRVARPPGSGIRTEPRAARAPGHRRPLVAHGSEGQAGRARPGGTL